MEHGVPNLSPWQFPQPIGRDGSALLVSRWRVGRMRDRWFLLRVRLDVTLMGLFFGHEPLIAFLF
jgi:hypothetical protein